MPIDKEILYARIERIRANLVTLKTIKMSRLKRVIR